MKERFKTVRTQAHLSMKAFGERIGLVASSVQRVESGIYNPSEQTIRAVCNEFHVNRRWLETGEGEMYDATPADLIAQVADEHHLGEGGRMLLRVAVKIFERLGPDALDTIINETIPAIMEERGISPAALAAERAEPLSDDASEAD